MPAAARRQRPLATIIDHIGTLRERNCAGGDRQNIGWTAPSPAIGPYRQRIRFHRGG
jgi:hypothetical protein